MEINHLTIDLSKYGAVISGGYTEQVIRIHPGLACSHYRREGYTEQLEAPPRVYPLDQKFLTVT